MDKLLGELNAVLTQYAQNGFAPFLEEYQTAHRDHGRPVLLLEHFFGRTGHAVDFVDEQDVIVRALRDDLL